jgi:hypothetical protein
MVRLDGSISRKKNGFQFNFGLNSLNKILKKERKKIPIN